MSNNSSNKNGSAGGGIGFVGLLTIAFVVLKLCKVIDWSWWWVASPVWISAALVVAVFVVVVIWAVVQDKRER